MEFVEGKEWIEVNLHPLDVYKAIAASRSDLSQMLSNIGTAMMKSKSSAQLNRLELELPKEYDPYCSPQLRSGLWCLHRRNNCPRCALAVDVNNAGERVNDAEGAGAAEIMADMAANELCTLLQN